MPDPKPRGTDRLDDELALSRLTELQRLFKKEPDANAIEYIAVPSLPPVLGELAMSRPWRVLLQDVDGSAIGLELYGEVILGRSEAVVARGGLDLEPWGARNKGISRLHAMLRPTPKALYLVDVGSTNGTYVNGDLLDPGSNCPLQDEDILMLGLLILKISIVKTPSQARAGEAQPAQTDDADA